MPETAYFENRSRSQEAAAIKKNYYLIFVLICLVPSGCATYGQLEKDYGNSYRRALTGQIQNPAASENLNPVTGLPGDAAAAAMDQYVQSFNKDAKKAESKSVVVPVVPLGGNDGYDK